VVPGGPFISGRNRPAAASTRQGWTGGYLFSFCRQTHRVWSIRMAIRFETMKERERERDAKKRFISRHWHLALLSGLTWDKSESKSAKIRWIDAVAIKILELKKIYYFISQLQIFVIYFRCVNYTILGINVISLQSLFIEITNHCFTSFCFYIFLHFYTFIICLYLFTFIYKIANIITIQVQRYLLYRLVISWTPHQCCDL